MPELPEVETICCGLRAALLGKIIKSVAVNRRDLRQMIPEDLGILATGCSIAAIDRRAKYILILLSNNHHLVVHLGMSGRLVLFSHNYTPRKHDHVVIHLNDGSSLVYNDPRRFGLLNIIPSDAVATHKLFANLGIEPLSDAFTANALYAILKGKKANVKSVIMNQEHIVGVGNIYACESLYMAGISPLRNASEVSVQEASLLHSSICQVLRSAISAGGSSLRDYVDASGNAGGFQNNFSVYGRDNQICIRCSGMIIRTKQQGRSSFHCDSCQS